MLKIIVAEVKLILERDYVGEQTQRIENDKKVVNRLPFMFIVRLLKLIVLCPRRFGHMLGLHGLEWTI
ncbi:MAG: hypothetical protein AAES65_15895 [Candidatus Thiodiazotropha sp. (ex. Lucinoma kazani)]